MDLVVALLILNYDGVNFVETFLQTLIYFKSLVGKIKKVFFCHFQAFSFSNMQHSCNNVTTIFNTFPNRWYAHDLWLELACSYHSRLK